MSLAEELETTQDVTQNVIVLPNDLFSDEPPLESELHLRQIILLLNCLEWLWQDKNDFYAAGDLKIYYGKKQDELLYFRRPDFFVVLDTERKTRKSWVMWDEDGKYPHVILEILSELTVNLDKEVKKKFYQNTFRTPNYFWFDPYTLEFAGFDLLVGEYQPIQPNDRGHLWSQQLNLYLGIHQGLLRLFTAEGELVPTPEEQADSEREQKEYEREQKEIALQKAERLAAKLRELNIDPDAI